MSVECSYSLFQTGIAWYVSCYLLRIPTYYTCKYDIHDFYQYFSRILFLQHAHTHTHINHTNTLIEYDIQAIHQNVKNDEFENLLKEIENFYSFDYARY